MASPVSHCIQLKSVRSPLPARYIALICIHSFVLNYASRTNSLSQPQPIYIPPIVNQNPSCLHIERALPAQKPTMANFSDRQPTTLPPSRGLNPEATEFVPRQVSRTHGATRQECHSLPSNDNAYRELMGMDMLERMLFHEHLQAELERAMMEDALHQEQRFLFRNFLTDHIMNTEWAARPRWEIVQQQFPGMHQSRWKAARDLRGHLLELRRQLIEHDPPMGYPAWLLVGSNDQPSDVVCHSMDDWNKQVRPQLQARLESWYRHALRRQEVDLAVYARSMMRFLAGVASLIIMRSAQSDWIRVAITAVYLAARLEPGHENELMALWNKCDKQRYLVANEELFPPVFPYALGFPNEDA
ncbi:hypothetical protein B0T22DRAFT_109323 [Podospora appendiculata]|uniref:Uncharacterized protein n=1 Tax=Podospora appendiculata TaxID=314037 RepID=A0AAE0XMB1_9PEZI|nr:hypothetical protein B0T22DRAFT_109323 [Podospora appendiculata]